MKQGSKIIKSTLSVLAAAALAGSMVPVGAVTAFADTAAGADTSAGTNASSSASGSTTSGTGTGSSSAADASTGTGAGTGDGTTTTPGAGDTTTDPVPDPTPTPDPDPAPDTSKLEAAVKPVMQVSYAYSHSKNTSQEWKAVRYDGTDFIPQGTRAHVTTTSTTQRIEALRFSVSAAGQTIDPAIKDSYTMGIYYKALTGKKWSAWTKNGSSVGKDGTKIQAVRIKLTGTASKYYSIFYRVKTRGTSWLGWASNGAKAGTSGILRDVSDLEVVIRKKGKNAPGSSEAAFITDNSMTATYSLTKSSGSVSKANDLGKTAGKASKSASSITGMAVTNNSQVVSGGYTYKVYQKTKGWSATAKDGKRAGVKNKNYPVMAVSLNRTGKLKSYYDVYYRVYLKGYGWLGWAKNGQTTGNKTYPFYVSALQVQLVYKGGVAPGSVKNVYSDSNGFLKKANEKAELNKAKARLDAKAAKTSSSTGYLLLCDRSTCYTAVYTGSKGNWKRVKFWQCCVGASVTPTPKGSYTVEGKEYVFHGEENSYSCYYGVVFDSARELMFHSVGYKNNGSQKDKDIIFSNLGSWASHGCVRLQIDNAKWLYDHLTTGTKVVIF